MMGGATARPCAEPTLGERDFPAFDSQHEKEAGLTHFG